MKPAQDVCGKRYKYSRTFFGPVFAAKMMNRVSSQREYNGMASLSAHLLTSIQSFEEQRANAVQNAGRLASSFGANRQRTSLFDG